MGYDICYTNHADADQDDREVLLILLANVRIINLIMDISGLDDVMLNDQTTSFYDALCICQFLGLPAVPEF